MHISCTICQELLLPSHTSLIIPCGHLYHEHCLLEWLKQKKSCPQCRAGFRTQPVKVYFNIIEELNDSEFVASKIDEALNQSEEWRNKYTEIVKQLEPLKENNERLNRKLSHAENESQKNTCLMDALKCKVTALTARSREVESQSAEFDAMKKELSSLKKLQEVVYGTEEEVSKSLKMFTCNEQSIRQLCTYVEVLKSRSARYNKRCRELSDINSALSNEVLEKNRIIEQLKAEAKNFRKQVPETSPMDMDIENERVLNSVDENARNALSDRLLKERTDVFGFTNVTQNVYKQPTRNLERELTEPRAKPYIKPSKRLMASLKTQSTNQNSYVYDGMGGSKSVSSIVNPMRPEERLRKVAKAAEIKKTTQVTPSALKRNPVRPSKLTIASFFPRTDMDQSVALLGTETYNMPVIDLVSPRPSTSGGSASPVHYVDSSHSPQQYVELD